ncbi:MAG: peptidylprolyl isomerase, partial [Vitreoscilla sp.]|nr:peptidylprolyl isomerase [Vitreoscilla sp.]
MKKLALAAVLCGIAYSSFAATPVRIETNMGNIDLVLDEQKAPITVKNFVSYANKGHYNGTVFHRVIDGCMIQGGGMDAQMREKATDKAIVNEARNGLQNTV